MSLFSLLPKPKSSSVAEQPKLSQEGNTQTVALNTPVTAKPQGTLATIGSASNAGNPSTALATINTGNQSIMSIQDPASRVALQGHRVGKVVYASFEDLIAKNVDDSELVRPAKEEEKQIALLTKDAIDARVQQKIKTAYNLSLQEQQKREEQVDFVKYTPVDPITGQSAQPKIIRIVEEERDPLEPPRFKVKKLPTRPPSPPVPIMRAPDRKLTNEDMENWKIPPCVSNWKNKHGYVVPLDKRMAADGRRLKNVQVSDRFASIAKAVYETEKEIREEIEKRKEYERAVEKQEKEKEEEELRNLAMEVRRSTLNPEEMEGFKEREELRKKLREEAIEEHRKEMLKRKKAFYSEMDDDREISDEVTLQSHVVSTQNMGGYQQGIDSRLEQLASSDMGTGFGDDDDYNVYDKPLVNQSSESVLYRPRQGLNLLGDEEEIMKNLKSRFTRAALGTNVGPRDSDAPIDFQSDNPDEKKSSSEKREDDFDTFLSSTTTTLPQKRSLDHIGRGFMAAAAGGAPTDPDYYRQQKRTRIGFTRSTTQQ